jgi:hypothetical protein
MQQVGKQKTRRPAAECCKTAVSAHAKLRLSRSGCFFRKPPDAKRRAQYFLLSDLPHRWIYFDYDQGPLSCVHLPFFANYMAAAPAPRAGIGHILFYYSAAKKWGQP